MEFIVYKISNSINSKLYFGVTQQELKIRWQQHKCNSNKKNYHLYNAIKKHGFKSFKIELVCYCGTKEKMYSKEKQLIKLYKTNNPMFGYNNSLGGESSRYGSKMSDKTKKKISDYQKIRKRTPHSQETKDKIGRANKGKTISEKHKKAISNANKGKTPGNIKAVVLNGIKEYPSITIASLDCGISITSISNNLTGLSKTTKIGKWEYLQTN